MYLISEFLTPMPHTVQGEENLSQVRRLMEMHHIRHLPVCRDKELIGVVSERDLYLVMGISDLNWRAEPARIAMMPNPLRVSVDEKAVVVAEAMLEKKMDCALVENLEGELIGIFTETDALKAMIQLMHYEANPDLA